jgi:hypothetical protein
MLDLTATEFFVRALYAYYVGDEKLADYYIEVALLSRYINVAYYDAVSSKLN